MRGDNIWIIAAAALLLLLVMSAIQLVLLRRRRQLERQYKELEQTISGDDEQYMRIVDESRNYRHIRHDLKKQERVMAMAAGGIGITKYTGNIVLDSVLTQEYSDAEAGGVVMDIDTPDGLGIELSDKEIVSLFANLLDNARESCERCRQNGGQAPLRKNRQNGGQAPLRIGISIKLLNKVPDPLVVKKPDFMPIPSKRLTKVPDPSDPGPWRPEVPDPLGTWLLIEVENSKSETEHMDVDDMKTSKADKANHGYGVAIICDIVRKYNGEIYMRDERDMFRTEIRIPL